METRAGRTRRRQPVHGEDEGRKGHGRELAEFEKLLADLTKPRYSFVLYVAGNSARSLRAIANVRRLCEKYLPDQYDLQVVDAYQRPERLKEAQIIALPTLVKHGPPPSSRFVGDISEIETIVVKLQLEVTA